jgi:hypothetical protein
MYLITKRTYDTVSAVKHINHSLVKLKLKVGYVKTAKIRNNMNEQILQACKNQAMDTIFSSRPESLDDWEVVMSYGYDDYSVSYPEGFTVSENFEGYSTSYIKECLELEYATNAVFAKKVIRLSSLGE